VMPLDGGATERVTHTPAQEFLAVWSPKGSALAFSVFAATGGVWVVRRNAPGQWGTPVQRSANGFWPGWSPDGRSITFATRLLDGSLAVVGADSGAPRILVDASKPGAPRAAFPQYSQDGRTIYFKSHDDAGTASIWSVPATGGEPELLLRIDQPSVRFDWTLGGGRIFYSIQDHQSNIWVAEMRQP